MHALVLGAGVVGVTTAYYLSQLGWRVTVVDRASEVGSATSFANGGQLSYSFTDAFARPSFIPSIPGLLLGRNLGTRVRSAPGLIGWGLRFLAQCTSERARQNTVAVLQRAARSAELMAELRSRVPIEFAHEQAGKLVLLSSERALSTARRNSALKEEHGCTTEILGRNDAIDIEPSLRYLNEGFVAAIWSREDSVRSARPMGAARMAAGVGAAPEAAVVVVVARLAAAVAVARAAAVRRSESMLDPACHR